MMAERVQGDPRGPGSPPYVGWDWGWTMAERVQGAAGTWEGIGVWVGCVRR